MQASYARYHDAGSVWTDTLRSSCHTITSLWMTLFPSSVLSPEDRDRIISYTAAIPIALKQQIRHSRDLRELKGLLSSHDLADLQCAENMPIHCLDVIRSYFYKASIESIGNEPSADVENRMWIITMVSQFTAIEEDVVQSLYATEFTLAPGFIIVLNALLIIWFMILPFVLTEISGWLTIVWVPMIAYGLLGMYSVCKELQQPFGYNLNDLDLNALAHVITRDVLMTYNSTKDGMSMHLQQVPTRISTAGLEILASDYRERPSQNLPHGIALASEAFSYKTIGGMTVWAFLSVAASYVVSRISSVAVAKNEECYPWWCSLITVQSSVISYIGFALFLLLGFRLKDSHSRYRQAIDIWSDGILNLCDLLSNRFLGAFGSGWASESDLERFSAHLACSAVALVARRRREDCLSAVATLVEEDDAARIANANEPAYYCIDVVRSYILEGERRMIAGEISPRPPEEDEVWSLMYVNQLERTIRICERVANVPLPFGYVQHLRIFTLLWLSLLPLALVEATGWVAIAWVTIIAYAVFGVEHWATELADPFGYDISDVPLGKLQVRVVDRVRRNLRMFVEKKVEFVQEDRLPFVEEEAVIIEIEEGDGALVKKKTETYALLGGGEEQEANDSYESIEAV